MNLQRTDGNRRAGWFTLLLVVVTAVNDGWSGRASPAVHQLLLLPLLGVYLGAMSQILRSRYAPSQGGAFSWTAARAVRLAFGLEWVFPLLYFYEAHHFAAFGYQIDTPALLLLVPGLALLGRATVVGEAMPSLALVGAAAAYAGGLVLSVLSFPLNYLRSDMLPVIFWADRAMLTHVDPYRHLAVGARIYDFPYLPGMMLAYLPFAAADLDLRLGGMFYVLGTALLVFWAAKPHSRAAVAALLALFLVCPFLQYRHELYIQPHWFVLAVSTVLMQRRRFAMAAVALGASMAIYQFSWILFPFFLLNAYRRRGAREAVKLAGLGAAGALALLGPFLAHSSSRIRGNTVSQWGLLPHAVADPLNLSYWATFLIRPSALLLLQAVLMVTIFLWCLWRKRCQDLPDTLRWMCVALTVFVLFNVVVDGYFFLMLLLLLLLFTCAANGWWADPSPAG